MYIRFTEINLPVLAAISEKADGSMRLAGHRQDTENKKNIAGFVSKNFPSSQSVISPGLVHGNQIEVISMPHRDLCKIPNRDGLVTNIPNILLTVTAADCPTLFVFDPENKAIGIAHCGWKGLNAGIVRNLIKTMVKEYGTQPNRLLAAIGPGIGLCHFEVGDEVADLFPMSLYKSGEHQFVNLVSVIEKQLAQSIAPPWSITNVNECTVCSPGDRTDLKYFSFRRDKPKTLETMLAGIMLTEPPKSSESF